MLLPDDFQFSQSSLQDFTDCPRRFQLRYLKKLSWPAVEAEPVLEHERLMQLGSRFHQLAHQYFSGVPGEILQETIHDPQLKRWWDHFLDFAADLAEWEVSSEATLSVPFAGHRLLAKYDLLAYKKDHSVLIIDWKTSPKKPSRKWMEDKLQTRVYPYLLVKAGQIPRAGTTDILPEKVVMMYWFPGFPEQAVSFPYSAKQFTRDETRLTQLAERMLERCQAENEDFPLTTDQKHCRYCRYRSLCKRGEEAGPLSEREGILDVQTEEDLELNFDQIAEIEY
jgi:CRISPR/Cas system-associated exonuclease Cas4 (RecB family)